MRKGIIFVVFCFLVIFISLSYAEEPTVYQEVYYDDKDGANHFKIITDALAHMDESGVLYIGKPIYISSSGVKSLTISKSMTIKGMNNQDKNIIIGDFNAGPVFNLSNISSFELEGINASGGNATIVKGSGDNIIIRNSKFLNCNPVYTTSLRLGNLVLDSNTVIGGNTNIQPYSYGAQVTVKNNYFGVSGSEIRGFNLENCQMLIENNHFDGVSFNVHDGEKAVGWIQHNIFENDGRKILVNEDNQDLHFQNNKIYKATGQVYYGKTGLLDFTKNWWGSKDGPVEDIFYGSIDYDNWALFEDFRRYQKDPYNVDDLKAVYSSMGELVDEENWIYDLSGNSILDFFDIIGISRKIE